MRIILTHEQADFDAMGSLLGAYLVDEGAIPVLPRHLNRNVRAFLTLYGVDLPFVDPRDLPAGPVEMVTLVDTQSMVSIKGMSKETRVHVIDHHPLREDFSPDWSITVAGTGANTTLFLESLPERDNLLSPVEATLLLLGIYEDTGSLTYSRTTARDLRAASFLLEQGASLQIAAEFLNHPLSKQQQILYDSLRSNAEVRSINGQTILIATADAADMDEELSTVVHKLRDLLDPDALFVLVTIRGGVQLIARSTSDNIDVAAVAAVFGGGGHDRAAASLIKDWDLEQVYQELVRKLPEFIHPAVVVSQIMSPGPQLLPPETPVSEAAQRMQRYGYEGYPVVRDGKVIGLLTRRAVDRAMSHKLNVPVSSLMEAGEHTIYPDDAVEHLQRLMTDTGWGQIPVVQRETGEIIGIVTRTDLLKTLAPRSHGPSRQSLVRKLESALPPARLALLKAVALAAHERASALYIVGGFVRDLLLDRPGLDYDLVVEGDAIQLAQDLAERYGGRVTSHFRFGTAKWIIGEECLQAAQRLAKAMEAGLPGAAQISPSDLPETLDLVSARTEFYTYPSALPTVERGSIKLDLHRRDFTINTLALRLDGSHWGELHDYWGGLKDLRQGLVRVLHSLSFVDDPTRILRAVRFEQRFDFRIEARTLDLLHEATSLLDRVSGDRIRHELNSILLEPRTPQMLARFSELNLLAAIHPDLVWDDWIRSKVEMLKEPGFSDSWAGWGLPAAGYPSAEIQTALVYLLWLLRLSPGWAQSVITRLKLSASLARMILQAIQIWPVLRSLVGAKPSEVVARLDDVSPLVLYALFLATEQTELRDVLWQYKTVYEKIIPGLDGHDLRVYGLKPGPQFRVILKALRDAWLDGKIHSKHDETALLDEMVRQARVIEAEEER
jgi:tRNA nucleotidyltransferase (CCA-adding enzyme)